MTAPAPPPAPRVAVTRRLPGDLDTPLGVYLKLAAQRPFTYLFESMEGGARWGRYSFIGLPAAEVVRVRSGRATVTAPDGTVLRDEAAPDALAWLRAYAAPLAATPAPGLPRFAGGLVGYFTYDCVRLFEPRVACANPDPLGLPDILLMRSDELVVFDNQSATLTLVSHAPADDAPARAAAEARLDAIEQQLAGPLPAASRQAFDHAAADLDFVSGLGEAGYKQVVARIQEYIAAGDVMQVVPSQRLSAPFTAEPTLLYRAIRRLNPSPYLYCLNLGDHHVVGSSPEVMVRVQDGVATVRPIAGTRPRGATPEEDRRLVAELTQDPKEIAEHLMLIDLGRNDVGRVSEVGQVRVTEKMVVEPYSHVMHIVSNVEGKLKPGIDALDALAATFPAGTLSGAPKVRAMEIIEELEPVRRGLYGGAVGYLAWGGNMDLAIAIRTAVIKDGRAHVQAGGGIVADSDPQAEWEETMNKARAMLRAAAMVG